MNIAFDGYVDKNAAMKYVFLLAMYMWVGTSIASWNIQQVKYILKKFWERRKNLSAVSNWKNYLFLFFSLMLVEKILMVPSGNICYDPLHDKWIWLCERFGEISPGMLGSG